MSLAAELEATRRGCYAPANPRASCSSNAPLCSELAASAAEYPVFSEKELRQMCAPIAPLLGNVCCYTLMGNSTQVVVVEEESPLNVPFIAAQETQVSTCFVWSASKRRYTGVLTVTEYLKVLLYCQDHPNEIERISGMNVREWRAARPKDRSIPEGLISVTADDSLGTCIQKMIQNKVRRLAVVADDVTNVMPSILSVITYSSLLQFMASRIFSVGPFHGDYIAALTAGYYAGCGPSLPSNVQQCFETDDVPLTVDARLMARCGQYSIFDVPYCKLMDLGEMNKYRTEHLAYPTAVTVSLETPIAVALKLLIAEHMIAVPVVDNGIIVDVVSRNDVIRMETGGVFNLSVSVREALLFHENQNNNFNSQQTVIPNARKIAVFYEYDTFKDIIIHFATRRVQVLFLVNPQTDEVIGQLSLSEVLWFLSKYSSNSSNTQQQQQQHSSENSFF